ncbi:MAG: hypothetical protein HOC27_02355 [Phycisphaerae bacterium]|jgi:hypothetical protein|nr:hypothetical protein [Phycisphaerae bacterium]
MFFLKTLLVCGIFLFGCETKTVEFRTRPTWHTALSGSNSLPSEEVRADGTIMKYSSVASSNGAILQEYLDNVVFEEKDELTGAITLRSVLPEHVLTHTLRCLRDRNWELLFDQIISSQMQQFYNQKEHGQDEFVEFFSSNRRELAKTLQRMHGGKGFGEVTSSKNGNVTVYTFVPSVSRNYQFKTVSFMREDEFLKLHSIR